MLNLLRENFKNYRPCVPCHIPSPGVHRGFSIHGLNSNWYFLSTKDMLNTFRKWHVSVMGVNARKRVIDAGASPLSRPKLRIISGELPWTPRYVSHTREKFLNFSSSLARGEWCNLRSSNSVKAVLLPYRLLSQNAICWSLCGWHTTLRGSWERKRSMTSAENTIQASST